MDRAHLTGIPKSYRFALAAYLFPLLPLAVFLIDQVTVNRTEMWFFLLFLLSILPCAIAGLVLSVIGLRQAWKEGSGRDRILGMVGVGAGSILLVGGILGPLLIYVVVAS